VTGRVLDDRGDPVAGAIVHLFRSAATKAEDRDATPATVTTGPTGRFELDPKGAGADHILVVVSAGHVPLCRTGVCVFRSVATELGDVRVERGFTVRGRVRADDGTPLAAARVRPLGPSSARSVYLGLDAAGIELKPVVVTDADGLFVLAGLTEAEWDLRLTAAGYAATTVHRLRMKPDERAIELTLRRGLTLEGAVRDAADRPVSGARIVLEAVADNAPLRPAPVVSDAEGHWVIPDLPEGSFVLQATAPGFQEARIEAATPSAAPVTLRLTRSAVVTGRVIAAGSKRPIVRFTVTVFGGRTGEDALSVRALRSYEEAVDGRFRLTGLEPGSCLVEVCAPGRAFGRSARFALEAGKEAPELAFSLEPAAELSGMVVDSEDGSPIAGAHVVAERLEEVRPAGESATPNAPERPAAPVFTTRARTDSDGLFALPCLAKGRYRISVSAEAFFARETVAPAGGSEAVYLLGLDRGAAVAGVVFDSHQRPVPGAPVALVARREGSERATAAGEKGRYWFRGLPAGPCWVQARLPGGAASPSSLRIRPGHVSRLDLNSGLASALTGTVRRLESGVAGIRMVARLEREEDGLGAAVRQAWSDDEGHYGIRGLPPGPYRLTAHTPAGLCVSSRSVDVIPRSRLNEDVNLHGGRVVGQVEAAVTSRPLPGVRARLRPVEGGGERRESGPPPGDPGGVMSDADGRFEIPFVPPGRYRIEAEREGFAAARSSPFEVTGDSVVGPVRLRLLGGASLSGVVLDQRRGASRISAIVRVFPQEASPPHGGARLQLARRGTFRLRGLRPGPHVLRFLRPGYRSRTVRLDVKPGMNGPMQVVLE